MPLHVSVHVMQEVATAQTAAVETDRHTNAGDRTSRFAQTWGYSFGVGPSPTGGETGPIDIMRTDPRVKGGPVTAGQSEQRLSGARASRSVISLLGSLTGSHVRRPPDVVAIGYGRTALVHVQKFG